MSMVQGVAVEERLRRLTALLHADGVVAIAPAARELGVSEMTIRRDLAELEERGAVRRVRGGAVPVEPLPFSARRRSRVRAKARIAAKLVPLVAGVDAVAFDASSTVMRLASSLDGARQLTVITNGPDTFAALQHRPGITALLTGGRLDPATGSLVGPIACRSATQLIVDRFVTSAAAVDARAGATEATLDDAEVKRALAAHANEVVLAIDAAKLDRRGVAVALDWSEIDVLVTELEPSDARLAAYRDLARVV